MFFQKLAAHLAGLGWIGKSCLLITPEHSPHVRWVTVLTDPPLLPTGTPMEQKCGACTACVDICPQHAFIGRSFCSEEPREARFDVAAWDRHFKEQEKSRVLRSAASVSGSARTGKKRGAGMGNRLNKIDKKLAL